MDIKEKIIIFHDFGKNPGARYVTDGPLSGEKFLREILLQKFDSAVSQNGLLFIDLDGTTAFPSSFISGSFGILSQLRTADKVLKHIKLKSEEVPFREEKVIYQIKNPELQNPIPAGLE